MSLAVSGKSPAVLLLVFNRPEQTELMLEAIKKAGTSSLYVACDGPRLDKPDDAAKVQAVRRLIEDIDWCTVRTNFRQTNLGCGRAVSDAITWFLSEAEEGIILEDDCLPDTTFFSFCAEMLERYRHDTKVMQIAGFNFLGESCDHSCDYLFSNFGWQWGWATWRRAWQKFDLKMTDWPRFKAMGLHRQFPFYKERVEVFDLVYGGSIDTWDYQWHFAMAAHSGISVVPSVNLVKNLGFGCGTHSTSAAGFERYNVKVRPMSFPLKHCDFVYADRQYDDRLVKAVCSLPLGVRLVRKAARIYRRFRPKSGGAACG
ncbi:hypothetical protein [Geomonas oryzae]|uniref:hypothetical protein n=1 Tax=Geomonas oryzae TaxID=2364273 RepID=UPI00100B30F1|nr:hypothetical protein [Geomonas oryzae]